LDAVVRNRKNCPFEDLERLLRAVGFVVRKPGGSHAIFKRGGVTISIPMRRPVREHYVDEVLTLLNSLD